MNINSKINEIYNLANQNRLNEVQKELLNLFSKLSDFVYLDITQNVINEIDNILNLTFKIILLKEFKFGDKIESFLSYTNLISNLCYLTNRDTNNIKKELLSREEIELDKVLFLTVSHSPISINEIEQYYNFNKELVSYWIYSTFYRYDFAEVTSWQNLKNIIDFSLQHELSINFIMTTLYFGATYVLPDKHLLVRKQLNNIIKNNLKYTPIINTPSAKKNKVAIATKYFSENHAAFKCVGSFLEAITKNFDVDLILFKKNDTEINREKYPIKNIYHIMFQNSNIDYQEIVKNDYNMVIFLDIGMTIESIFLSNIRIAPIQLSMYGHPVSTQSREIDYFIVGEKSEIDTSYYSETPINIDGSGMNPTIPPISRKGYKEFNREHVEIAILSSSFKINPESIAIWQSILQKSKFPIKFHAFIGNGNMQSSAVVKKELETALGNIEVHIFETYSDYIDILSNCDLSLGSYHYGDFNVIIDSLWTNTLPIVMEGTQAYQNTGVGALKTIKFNDLIAHSIDEYISKTVKLINNKNLRNLLRKKLAKTELIGTLIENQEYNNQLIEKLSQIIK